MVASHWLYGQEACRAVGIPQLDSEIRVHAIATFYRFWRGRTGGLPMTDQSRS